MKYVMPTLAFIAVGSSSESTALAAPATKTKYLVAHQEVDPRLITSIER
jgi:hypothetical protein